MTLEQYFTITCALWFLAYVARKVPHHANDNGYSEGLAELAGFFDGDAP